MHQTTIGAGDETLDAFLSVDGVDDGFMVERRTVGEDDIEVILLTRRPEGAGR